MYQDRKKLGFELLLHKLRSNFGKLILVNLIFAVPLFLSVGIAAFLYLYVFRSASVILPLILVLSAPFYSGVVALARDYSRDIRPDKILKTYLTAVKDNGLRFLCWGIVMYLGIVGCYFGFSLYSGLAASFGWIFYVVMFFLFVIAVFFLFMFYTVPLMTVSFDLRQKDIYKNSALMTFGEFKNNFFATLGTVALVAVVMIPFILISYLSSLLPVQLVKVILTAYLPFAFGVLIPAPFALIVSHYLYPNMYAMIAGDGIPNGTNSNSDSSEKKEPVTYAASEMQENHEPEFDIEELKNGDGEEYIFYQGKMIKRKSLLTILEQKEEEK